MRDKIKSMTSKERVLAGLLRQPVDRTPVCNPTSVATVELMDLVDAHFPEANRNPEMMARLAATGYTELGFDSIMPVFSIIQESSALGCKMQWEQKDNWPTVRMREPIWKDVDDANDNWYLYDNKRNIYNSQKKFQLNIISTISLPTYWTMDQPFETPYIFTKKG